MKRCPTCDRTYDDESLSFCPNDGAGLTRETPAAPVELQATMMATPSSLGGSSYPPPPSSSGSGSGSGVGSGSYNPPPPNASWATPSAPQSTVPPKGGGINKKLIFGGIGCVALLAIVGIIGIVVIYALSGPSSKMNPYKGDLKDLVPETVDTYTRVDTDVLGDRDKKNFGKVNDALGVAYKDSSDARIRMFIGNYASAKDAEDGLKSFKDELVSDGFSPGSEEKKKLGWRTVGIRYLLNKDVSKGKNGEVVLPDGATLVHAQESSSSPKTERRVFVGWTNGSVVHVVAAEGTKAVEFEKVFDAKDK